MSQHVPSSTPIKRSRAHNVDTDRLLRRRGFLVSMADDGFRSLGSRNLMVMRALELHAVENALDSRGVVYTRRTLSQAQADALSGR
jgi:hypothetical protein